MSVVNILLFVIFSVLNISCADVTFTKPEKVHSQDYTGYIVLGITIINIKSNSTTSDLFKEDICLMVESMLSWSSGTPLLFIVITDSNSAGGNFVHYINL